MLIVGTASTNLNQSLAAALRETAKVSNSISVQCPKKTTPIHAILLACSSARYTFTRGGRTGDGTVETKKEPVVTGIE